MKTVSIHALRALGISAALVLLAACAGQVQHRPSVPSSYGAYTTDAGSRWSYGAKADGPTVVRHLQERYAESFAACTRYAGDPDPLPALLCSGILMRVSKRGPGFDIWNPNPNSPTPNGVPFSWLRQDSKFDRLVFGYTSGFIILPYFYADNPSDNYTQLMVRCVFPFDGATNARTKGNADGCSEVPGMAGTGPCQDQGVYSAQEWIRRFGQGGMYGNQCGFRLEPGTQNAWQAFQAQSTIRQTLTGWFTVHNEIMVRTWTQGDTRIPLEAFFYINGDAVGLNEAKLNQADFKTRTGRWVPVIRLNLPTSPAGSAAFLFNEADQQIPQ